MITARFSEGSLVKGLSGRPLKARTGVVRRTKTHTRDYQPGTGNGTHTVTVFEVMFQSSGNETAIYAHAHDQDVGQLLQNDNAPQEVDLA